MDVSQELGAAKRAIADARGEASAPRGVQSPSSPPSVWPLSHKINEKIKTRLRKVGLWNEASAYKRERATYHANNGDVTDRWRLATIDMAKKYGVDLRTGELIRKEKPAESAVENETLRVGNQDIQATPDVMKALTWVVQVIGRKDITPEDAPSALAAGMLEMFRATPAAGRDLLKSMLPRMLPKQEMEAGLKAFFDDGGVLRRLGKLRKAAEKFVEDARRERTVACPACGADVEWPVV